MLISPFSYRTTIVSTEAWQYGFFDMIVEIGSSVGLWLGLSAVDLATANLDLFKRIGYFLSKIIALK